MCENCPDSELISQLKNSVENDAGAYLLITQPHSSPEMRISHSKDYSASQIEEIRKILGRPTLTTIKPVLNTYKKITLERNKPPDELITQYRDLFNSLTQVVCKEIAKSWIKILEPNKQALFPYRDGDRKKPAWWPAKVKHIEPDHLDKIGRVELLVNIIRHPEFNLFQGELINISLEKEIWKSIIKELLYLEVYERLFYNLDRENDQLYQYITIDERELIKKDKIEILASDFRTSNCALIMAIRVQPSDLNHRTFHLNSDFQIEKKHKSRINKRSSLPDLRKARRLQKDLEDNVITVIKNSVVRKRSSKKLLRITKKKSSPRIKQEKTFESDQEDTQMSTIKDESDEINQEMVQLSVNDEDAAPSTESICNTPEFNEVEDDDINSDSDYSMDSDQFSSRIRKQDIEYLVNAAAEQMETSPSTPPTTASTYTKVGSSPTISHQLLTSTPKSTPTAIHILQSSPFRSPFVKSNCNETLTSVDFYEMNMDSFEEINSSPCKR